MNKAFFSFNAKGGRCEACQGLGFTKIEMGFLADAWLICESCKGLRYSPEVLEVKIDGFSIADVLNMTVSRAIEVFSSNRKLSGIFKTMTRLGLGYVKLGQGADTLSGGEAQRLKLAKDMASFSRQKDRASNSDGGLYIFDEPTVGLHPEDVSHLLKAFEDLVESGHTVLVVEHNRDVICTADYIVDLGPEGGPDGGNLVAFGSPLEVSKIESSWTGQMLRSSQNMESRPESPF
jgi:excinuclease ABC subunit A